MRRRVPVLACLPHHPLTRLRAAISLTYDVELADTWADLIARTLHSPARVLVLDPERAPIGLSDIAIAIGVSVVLYASFTPEAVRRTLALAAQLRSVPVSIALHGYDDSADTLLAVIDTASAAGIAEQLAQKLAPRMGALPLPVQRSLLHAIRAPTPATTVETLAADAGVSERTLRRFTKAAQIASPKTLLLTGRVIVAYHQLRLELHPLTTIAARMGYGGSTDLVRHIVQATGKQPREVRRMAESELLGVLSSRLTTT